MPSVTASELGSVHLRSGCALRGCPALLGEPLVFWCKLYESCLEWHTRERDSRVSLLRIVALESLSRLARVGLFGTAALRERCTPRKIEGKYRRKTDSEQVE